MRPLAPWWARWTLAAAVGALGGWIGCRVPANAWGALVGLILVPAGALALGAIGDLARGKPRLRSAGRFALALIAPVCLAPILNVFTPLAIVASGAMSRARLTFAEDPPSVRRPRVVSAVLVATMLSILPLYLVVSAAVTLSYRRTQGPGPEAELLAACVGVIYASIDLGVAVAGPSPPATPTRSSPAACS